MNRKLDSLTNDPRRLFAIIAGGMALLFVIALMYGKSNALQSAYGKRRGASSAASVNGTAVLANLFDRSGRYTHGSSTLNRSINRYDTIVWFPDDFTPPAGDAVNFLDAWLSDTSKQRTFIFVGRDFDGTERYWDDLIASRSDAPLEYERRRAHARSEYDRLRGVVAGSIADRNTSCPWFRYDLSASPRVPDDWEGPWSATIDPKKTKIPLRFRLVPPAGFGTERVWLQTGTTYETLLQSENDVAAYRIRRQTWGKNQVIVVTNGAFLLNYGLVNHEHRKLASELIQETRPGGKTLFLESSAAGLQVIDREPSPEKAFALRIFSAWPLSFVVVHFAAFGIAYCIANFPIFGRPRNLPSEERADFGLHVLALGDLMSRSQDYAYARNKLDQYRTQAKRSSGKSHRFPK